jgi:uncharacterized membrane protein YphA (DoxX/SURF4 family)
MDFIGSTGPPKIFAGVVDSSDYQSIHCRKQRGEGLIVGLLPRSDEMTSEVTAQIPMVRAREASKIVDLLPGAARVLLGLLFFVSGLNGFLNFLPQPSTPLPAGANAFAGALMNTGYMFPLIMATQWTVGTLLLLNRFVPLALALLAPFIVNSIAFHIFLEPSGRPLAFAVLAFELYLAWTYRKAFRPMLAARVR